jgi:phospholipase/carboxylesterase
VPVLTPLLFVIFSVTMCACGPAGPVITRLQARPAASAITIEPGAYPLGLDASPARRTGAGRDGTLYIPRSAAARTAMPLLVLLHGGGGRADDFRHVFPLAEEYGVVIVALDSRDNTWDGIDSPYGPDVVALDAALQRTFRLAAIDSRKVALGGVSDGASYALSLGIANGDLFTHLIAVAAGGVAPPAPAVGRPRIFVAHGTRDNVYSVRLSRSRLVPQLRRDGYEVTYFEFDGPHWMTVEAARHALAWLTSETPSTVTTSGGTR